MFAILSIFYNCRSLSVDRRMVLNYLKRMESVVGSFSDQKFRMLFCRGLGPKRREKGSGRKIFSVIAETNRVI